MTRSGPRNEDVTEAMARESDSEFPRPAREPLASWGLVPAPTHTCCVTPGPVGSSVSPFALRSVRGRNEILPSVQVAGEGKGAGQMNGAGIVSGAGVGGGGGGVPTWGAACDCAEAASATGLASPKGRASLAPSPPDTHPGSFQVVSFCGTRPSCPAPL